MHLAILPLTSLLALAGAFPGPKLPSPPLPHTPSPISDRTITISHRAITSQRSFIDTRAALESAIPKLNTTFMDQFTAGNVDGAREALKALPALSSFVVPPRDFGRLVTIWGVGLTVGEAAIQYEIGNPYTASKFGRFNLAASLYPPIRVLLFEQPVGVVQFTFDRPTTTFGQFKDERMTATAQALEDELTQLFLFAGGWPSQWPLPALP